MTKEHVITLDRVYTLNKDEIKKAIILFLEEQYEIIDAEEVEIYFDKNGVSIITTDKVVREDREFEKVKMERKKKMMEHTIKAFNIFHEQNHTKPLILADYDGIKLGQKYFPSHLKVTKSMQPYEVAKDAGSLWYFTMYDGSGSAIARLWKTMTVDEFNKNWISADKVTPI